MVDNDYNKGRNGVGVEDEVLLAGQSMVVARQGSGGSLQTSRTLLPILHLIQQLILHSAAIHVLDHTLFHILHSCWL